MKKIAIIDEPKSCASCPLLDMGYALDMCKLSKRQVTTMESISIPKWCELRHPLKEVSNDFYIYDRKYLFAHLDQEIDLLKGTKAFEELMKAKE